jgi:hypothetical protein
VTCSVDQQLGHRQRDRAALTDEGAPPRVRVFPRGAGREPAGDRRGGHAPGRVPRDGRRRSADRFPRPARGPGSGPGCARRARPLRCRPKSGSPWRRCTLWTAPTGLCSRPRVRHRTWRRSSRRSRSGWSSTPSASGGIRTSGVRLSGPGRASRPLRCATGLCRSEPTSSCPAATRATAASTSRHSPRRRRGRIPGQRRGRDGHRRRPGLLGADVIASVVRRFFDVVVPDNAPARALSASLRSDLRSAWDATAAPARTNPASFGR